MTEPHHEIIAGLQNNEGFLFERFAEIFVPLEFDSTSYKSSWLILRNLTFNGSLKFSDVNLNVGVKFENCTFRKEVEFCDVICEGYDEPFSEKSIGIFFNNCKFSQSVIFQGTNSQIERGIEFEKCFFENDIEFIDITIATQSIVIDNCKLNKRIAFKDCMVKQAISIFNSEISSGVRFQSVTSSSINFIKSHFKREIMMWNCQIANSLVFNDGEYDDEVKLTANKAKALNIIGGKYQEAFSVDYEDRTNNLLQGFNELYFESCDFVNGLNITGSSTKEVLSDTIYLKVSNRMKGDILLSSLHVGELFLHGINSNATIKLDGIRVNDFSIENFHNHSQLVLVDIRASHLEWFSQPTDLEQQKPILRKSIVSITHSSLGKAQLYGVNFKSFARVWINNSIMSEIIMSNVKWFEHKQFIFLEDENVWLENGKKKGKLTENDTIIIVYLGKKEIYRQLKFACDKQGDRIQALEFQRWEMYYYKRCLQLTNDKNLGNRLTLFLSQTNDFGLNWIKPLLIICSMTFLVFFPILVIIGSNELTFFNINTSINLEPFIDNFNVIPKLFDPTRKIDNLCDKESSGFCFNAIDYLQRIILAFFIFQIVSAFRKYVKS